MKYLRVLPRCLGQFISLADVEWADDEPHTVVSRIFWEHLPLAKNSGAGRKYGERTTNQGTRYCRSNAS